MNVRELMAKLSRLDPDLPVVMSQEDEPPGCYEVNDVDLTTMCHRARYRYSSSDVWSGYSSPSDRLRDDEEPRTVVFLGPESPQPLTVDGEVGHAALPAGLGG